MCTYAHTYVVFALHLPPATGVDTASRPAVEAESVSPLPGMRRGCGRLPSHPGAEPERESRKEFGESLPLPPPGAGRAGVHLHARIETVTSPHLPCASVSKRGRVPRWESGNARICRGTAVYARHASLDREPKARQCRHPHPARLSASRGPEPCYLLLKSPRDSSGHEPWPFARPPARPAPA